MALAIRADMTAIELRAWARRASDPRAGSRAFAIANALEGMTRADAARLAGMERQTLRDAVVRYNAEGLNGLSDRPRQRPSRLTEGQQAALRALILRGPDPERDGVSAWTRADIARLIEARFGHRYHVSSLSKILRSLGFSRQKVRPTHPNADPKARMAWLKKGSCPPRWLAPRTRIRTSGSRSISRMKRGSVRRAAHAIAGGYAASDRPGLWINATPLPTPSRPSNRQPDATSAWCCRRSRPQP
jgi:transposase